MINITGNINYCYNVSSVIIINFIITVIVIVIYYILVDRVIHLKEYKDFVNRILIGIY